MTELKELMAAVRRLLERGQDRWPAAMKQRTVASYLNRGDTDTRKILTSEDVVDSVTGEVIHPGFPRPRVMRADGGEPIYLKSEIDAWLAKLPLAERRGDSEALRKARTVRAAKRAAT